jgi:rubrerythrin
MEGDEMSETSRQPKDKNYNLISALYQASDNVETFKTYAQDAQTEGDQELANFFEMVIENNLKASQQAKEMLVARLQQEEEVGAHEEAASAGPVSAATDTVGGVTDTVGDTVGGVTEPVRGVTDKLLGGGGGENQR